MSQFLAEDMRTIADKINEYLAITEVEDKEKDPKSGESLDHLLTKPATIKDIVDKIDFNSLVRKLNLNSMDAANFKKSIDELAKGGGKISEEAAKSIADAFKNLSGVTDVRESGYNWETATTDDIKSAIFDAREKARLHPYYTKEAISFIREATTEIKKRVSKKTSV